MKPMQCCLIPKSARRSTSLRNAARRARTFSRRPDWDAGFDFSDAGFSGWRRRRLQRLFQLAVRPRRARASGREAERVRRCAVRISTPRYRSTWQMPITAPRAHLSLREARLDESGNVVSADRVLDVQIPKGVKEGQSIRLRGQGSPGFNGGPAGDLYLEVGFEPDARYRIEGRDVTQTVPVAPWEAALGATIEVPTPAGRVEVKVPAGSNNGRKLRLKGRGIPGDPPGDLYLELELAAPPATSEKARELYGAMAREFSSFNPREQAGAQR